jgi:hypothetical protein
MAAARKSQAASQKRRGGPVGLSDRTASASFQGSEVASACAAADELSQEAVILYDANAWCALVQCAEQTRTRAPGTDVRGACMQHVKWHRQASLPGTHLGVNGPQVVQLLQPCTQQSADEPRSTTAQHTRPSTLLAARQFEQPQTGRISPLTPFEMLAGSCISSCGSSDSMASMSAPCSLVRRREDTADRRASIASSGGSRKPLGYCFTSSETSQSGSRSCVQIAATLWLYTCAGCLVRGLAWQYQAVQN